VLKITNTIFIVNIIEVVGQPHAVGRGVNNGKFVFQFAEIKLV